MPMPEAIVRRTHSVLQSPTELPAQESSLLPQRVLHLIVFLVLAGGDDGTRTRDLMRDRHAF